MQRDLRHRRQEIGNIQQAKVGEAFAKFFPALLVKEYSYYTMG